MAYPTALSNVQDGSTDIIAAHINELEKKVGVDSSTVPTSLDYRVDALETEVADVYTKAQADAAFVENSQISTDLATDVASDAKVSTPKSINTFVAAAIETFRTAVATLTNKTLTKPVVNASVQGVQAYTPAAAGTATLDLALANRNLITMPAGNITIALSNAVVGQIFTIDITQDGVGTRTVTWFSTIRWAGGSAPTLTTTASKRDSFIFICTGAGTYDGFVIGFNV